MKSNRNIKKVLIYRLGSLGDTVVALPAFKLIRQAFPLAEIALLSNHPVARRAAPIQAILEGSGLVDHFFLYSIGLRSLAVFQEIRELIRRFSPDVLVYLSEPRGLLKTFRDMFFFRWCGITKIIGLPWRMNLQKRLFSPVDKAFEYETCRMLRCISELGSIPLDDPKTWDLQTTESERHKSSELLRGWKYQGPFFAASLGTKMPAKFWGLESWQQLFDGLSSFPGMNIGLVLVGATDELDLSVQGAAPWRGPVLNACGKLSPRESFDLLGKADFFIGHDSGPMHLAAAAQTKVFALFSARNLPKVWYPYGRKHVVYYPEVPCKNCRLEVCPQPRHCMQNISPTMVAEDIRSWYRQYGTEDRDRNRGKKD